MQIFKGFCHLFFCGKTPDQSVSRSFVDHIRSFPLFFFRIFAVAQQENQFFCFTRLQSQVDLMAGAWVPATGYGTGTGSGLHSIRNGVAVASSEEIIAAGVEAVNRSIYRKEAVMIAALPIFRFVINSAAFDLNLAGT